MSSAALLTLALLFTRATFAAADSSKDMSATPFAAANAAPAGPQDYNKLFKAEIDNLEFSNAVYSWIGTDVEERVLKRYSRLPQTKAR